VADTEGFEARERVRGAMASVGESLAAGEPPDASADRGLAQLAARIDATLWNHDSTETSAR